MFTPPLDSSEKIAMPTEVAIYMNPMKRCLSLSRNAPTRDRNPVLRSHQGDNHEIALGAGSGNKDVSH